MSDVVQINRKSLIREQASVWLVRLQEGLSKDQQAELSDWLAVDIAHNNELLELATLWDDMGVLIELAPLFDDLPGRLAGQAKTQQANHWSPGWAIASSMAALSVMALFLLTATTSHITPPSDTVTLNDTPQLKPKIATQHYQTEVGEHSETRLSDGSLLTLNTNSHVVVDFNDQFRNIKLIHGEVHFAVAKDPSRPLSVMVNGKAVQAVGTAFSVRKNASNELVVAVDEGKVAVFDQSDVVSGEQPILTSALQAGDVLTIVGNTHNVVRLDGTEMEDRLAWRQGMIVINDDTLESVISEFSRHTKQKVLLADKNLGAIRVAGYFRLGDLDGLLVALEQNFGIRSVYYKEDDIFVLSQL
jgi:transmembrane sensor